ELPKLLIGIGIEDDRAYRNGQHDIDSFSPGAVRTFAVVATLGFVFGIESKVDQRVVLLAGFHDYVAAPAAVAAGADPARNALLPAERHAAVATVARPHANFCLVNEHLRLPVTGRQSPVTPFSG